METNQDDADRLLSLAEACRLLPSQPSPATLWRWRVRGVRGIRLCCTRIGGRWAVTRRSLQEFLTAVTAACSPSDDRDSGGDRSPEMLQRLREQGIA
jgi:hypothetical protein